MVMVSAPHRSPSLCLQLKNRSAQLAVPLLYDALHQASPQGQPVLACPDHNRLLLALQGYLTLALAVTADRLLQYAKETVWSRSSRRENKRACPVDVLDRFHPGKITQYHGLSIGPIVEPGPNTWVLGADPRLLETVLLAIADNPPFEIEQLVRTPWIVGSLLEQCVPKEARKDLGEFYTPHWLCEYALEIVRWPGSGSGDRLPKLVDPACGAGAFLVPALCRATRYLSTAGMDSQSLLNAICSAIQGYDINPLAVLAARVAWLASLVSFLPDNGVFGIPVHTRDVLSAPFDSRSANDAAVIIGNPPWVRWSDLPATQRFAVTRAARHYDLIPAQTFHGGSEVDLSAVVAMASSDVDLMTGGQACFVLPKIHLHAPASSSFRRFVLPNQVPLSLDSIVDFSGMKVFRSVGAQAILLAWTKGQSRRASTECTRWTKQTADRLEPTWTWAQTIQHLDRQTLSAVPARNGKFCLVADDDSACAQQVLSGAGWVRGRKGVTTDLNGAFFVRVLEVVDATRLRVVNDISGRRDVPIHEFEVEAELVFPLLKGASQIQSFAVGAPTTAILLPNSGISHHESEQVFRQKYPAAHDHFSWVEQNTGGALSARSTFAKRLKPLGAPFFHVYNVGAYTFQPIKVVWPEIAAEFRAAVALPTRLHANLPPKTLVPDHKVYFAVFDDIRAANYCCAFLNAPRIRRIIQGFSGQLQIGTVLGTLRIPEFDPNSPAHARLSDAGAQAHASPQDPQWPARLDTLVEQVL